MDFSEKFCTLLSLTSTKSVLLANYVNIDSAQISRMKTGARRMPHDQSLLRNISEYFANRFDDEYRLSALYELTGDIRLMSDIDQRSLTETVYQWLVTEDSLSSAQSDHIVKRIAAASEENQDFISSEAAAKLVDSGSNQMSMFFKNEGKRQATRIFFRHLMSLNETGTIRVFSDESDEWLMEDSKYSEELSDSIRKLTEKGFRFQRIQPPLRNIEGSISDINRWLPTYFSGSMKMFYYPWARDELHRRTYVILPNHIALCSASLYGQRESLMTMVLTENASVDTMNLYFEGMMERCSTMTNVYTVDHPNKIADCIMNVATAACDGIYKSYRLPAHSLPSSLLATTYKRGNNYVKKIMDCYAKTQPKKEEVLKEYHITDICCLPSLVDVAAGNEPVPGTEASSSPVFYTLEDYRTHLEQILEYLNTYPNYNVLFLDKSEMENAVIYTKGDKITLLIKKAPPYTIYDVTDQILSSAICTYMKKYVETKTSKESADSNKERLMEEIERINKML